MSELGATNPRSFEFSEPISENSIIEFSRFLSADEDKNKRHDGLTTYLQSSAPELHKAMETMADILDVPRADRDYYELGFALAYQLFDIQISAKGRTMPTAKRARIKDYMKMFMWSWKDLDEFYNEKVIQINSSDNEFLGAIVGYLNVLDNEEENKRNLVSLSESLAAQLGGMVLYDFFKQQTTIDELESIRRLPAFGHER